METLATPIVEDLEGIQAPELGVPTPQEMEEPTKELAPAEVSTEVAAPTEEPTREPVTLTAMFSELAEEPDVPPVWHEQRERGEVPHSNFPSWTEALHPAQSLIPTGQTPLTLSKLRWQCHSQSMGEGGPGIKGPRNASGPYRRSQTRCCCWGPQAQTGDHTTSRLQGVAACLLRDSPSPAAIEVPTEARQPNALTRPAVATIYATHIVQDEATGVTYMDTVTASVGRVALRNPHMVTNLQGPTVEDITDLS